MMDVRVRLPRLAMSPLLTTLGALSLVFLLTLIFIPPIRKFTLSAAALIGGYIWLMYREATKNTKDR